MKKIITACFALYFSFITIIPNVAHANSAYQSIASSQSQQVTHAEISTPPIMASFGFWNTIGSLVASAIGVGTGLLVIAGGLIIIYESIKS